MLGSASRLPPQSKPRRPKTKPRQERTGSRRISGFTFTPEDAECLERAVESRFREIAVAAKLERDLRKMFADKETSLQHGYYIAYTGNDHKVVDEYDDHHSMILPLRVNIQMRTLKKALDVLFFEPFPHYLVHGSEGKGNIFKEEIIAFVRRKQAERKTLLHDALKEFSERKVFDALAHLFFQEMVGRRLLKVLSPNSRKEFIQKNIPLEILRPTPGLAAKVSRHLFERCFSITFDEGTLTKRFARLQEQVPANPSR